MHRSFSAALSLAIALSAASAATAAVPPAQGAPATPSIAGQWESVARNKGGIGNIIEFGADGRVTQISAAMSDATYSVQGEWLRLFYTDEATGKVNESDTLLELQGGDRFVEKAEDGSEQSWSERIGSRESETAPLVGQWCSVFLDTLTSYKEFTPAGKAFTRMPFVVLRGTYATAFRAPGLYETSTANATAGFVIANDPVRCPVTGAVADCNAQVLDVNTGNPFIKPEKSDTWTVGVILEPLPGLSGTLDYWNIVTKDQISIGSVAGVLANPAGFPAAVIGRDPSNNLPGIPNSGTLLYVSTPFQNANTVKTDGIDLDVVWKQSLKEWGTLTTEFQWTHVFNYSQTLGGTEFKYVGTSGNYDVSSGSGTPEDRWNLILGWQQGPWNVTGTVRYVSGYDEIPYQGVSSDLSDPDTGCLGLQYAGTNCRVASFTTLDLAASYSGFKNWQIFGSVINVFNRIAPYAPAAAYGFINYNYNYAFSGGTGTQFNLGVRYTFQ